MLDCDILIYDNDFIKNYIPYFNTKTVVCGGVNYEKLNKKNNLRFVYGINREVKKSKYRNRNPYRSFTAFNMLAPKKIFNKLSFYEDISSYGHEDTLLDLASIVGNSSSARVGLEGDPTPKCVCLKERQANNSM